jgi:hypothetical protein
MLTNYDDAISQETYVEYLGKLQAIISQRPTVHTIIAGDFNCASDTNFLVEFNKFVIENKLIVSDTLRVNSDCTYSSDDGMRSSWLDYFVCSTGIDSVLIMLKSSMMLLFLTISLLFVLFFFSAAHSSC